MQSFRIGLALSLILAAVPATAQACPMFQPLDPESARHADLVVTGRITRYRIVLDQESRRMRREMLARNPDMDPDLRESLENQTGFLTDSAHFDVIVDEAIVGRPGRRLRAVLYGSSSGESHRMPPGPYLIAFEKPRPDPSTQRGGLVHPVLQNPCSGAFLLPVDSPGAQAVRRVLAGEPPLPPPEPEPPAAPFAGPAPAAAPVAAIPAASDHPRPSTGIGRALLPWAALVAAILGLIAALILWAARKPVPDDDDDQTES